MHKKIVMVVSAVQFFLLAFAAVVVSDVHDRFFPELLDVKAKVTLDFSQSDLQKEDVFQQLGAMGDQWELGLMKVAPDLRGDQSGQIFIQVGQKGEFPKRIQRFGREPDAEIRDHRALSHSFTDGDYLVTGKTEHLNEWKDWLTSHRVDQKWSEETLFTILQFLIVQSDFGVALLAVSMLMVSLALYWLAVKAKGRALRVLAGVPKWRIQCEDFGQFVLAMVLAAAILDVLAALYVGFVHGWVFVPYYSKVLLLAETMVIFLTLICAWIFSVASWPNPEMLAMREPVVKRLARSSAVLKLVVFAFVLSAVSPAVSAYTNARKTAQEQVMWKSLADQVVLVFPSRPGSTGGAEIEHLFQTLQPSVGDIVRQAETAHRVVLSKAWKGDDLSIDGMTIAPYRYMIIVNEQWLDIVRRKNKRLSLVPLTLEQIPKDAKQFLELSIPLFVRKQQQAKNIWHEVKMYRLTGSSPFPFVGSGGQLEFARPKDVLLLVAPHVHALFNDNFLISVASSAELSFIGLEETQKLVSERGLQNRIRVNYMAEEGILRAQLYAYFVWLRIGSIVALLAALAIAATISAFIIAVLKAKRDFPLRLAGASWWNVSCGRIVKEWVLGGIVVMLIMLFQGINSLLPVGLTGLLVLAVLPFVHIGATSWVFAKNSLRQL